MSELLFHLLFININYHFFILAYAQHLHHFHIYLHTKLSGDLIRVSCYSTCGAVTELMQCCMHECIGLPTSGSWQDLKDHMREAGDVCYADVSKDGRGVVEFLHYDDMKYAARKLDNSKFRSHEVC